MRIRVLQHVPFEGPAAIGDWAQINDHTLDITRLDLGETLPAPSDFDWLIVMGGPMGVGDMARYPWMAPELACIRQALDSDRRVLGICLGAQLLAHALGAQVHQAPEREIGWFDVEALPLDGAEVCDATKPSTPPPVPPPGADRTWLVGLREYAAPCDCYLGGPAALVFDERKHWPLRASGALSLDFGTSYLLPQRVGLHRAKEMALTAAEYDAAAAQEIGFVNRVVPAEGLDAAVGEYVDRIVAGPPLALSMSKRLLDNAAHSSMAQAVEAEGLAQNLNFGTSDVTEAGLAFVEKRSTAFKGR